MSSPRIASKKDAENDHDKLVFLLSDMLFDSSRDFINEYAKQCDHEPDKCREAHSILYNACMNFAGRAIDILSVAIDDENERKIFIENAKKNICVSIDIAKDLRQFSNKDAH